MVNLAVTAEGWHGGDARLTVPWPIRERSRLLDRVLATLTPQRTLTVREAVTSDTSQPAEPPMTDRIGSREFVRNMPYKSGRVGTVVELGRSGPNTWIGFGSPAQRVYARLLVSPQGRLLRQEIVSPRHLIHDTVTYPGAQ